MREPPSERGRTDPRALIWNQRAIVDLDAVIMRTAVSQDLSRIVVRVQNLPHSFIERESLRAADLNRPVQGLAKGNVRKGGCHVLRGHWLELDWRQTHRASVRRKVCNGPDELEELGRVDKRVRNGRTPDHGLLCKLCAEIAAVLQPIGADHRQCDMMPNAGIELGCDKVAGRRLKKVSRSSFLERW